MKKSTNPLLNQNLSKATRYSPVEQRLIELYALEVKRHYPDYKSSEFMYIGFHAKDLVVSNNYDNLREANSSLMKREVILEGLSFGWEGSESFIGGYRMGKGDGKLIVKIPRDMIPYYMELAEMPYIRFAMLFRSDYDRPLYLLNDAIAEILDTTKKHVVDVGHKITLEPSQAMGKGWLHVKVSDLAKLLGIENNAYFKKDGDYIYGEIKRSILKPRFEFLTKYTDLSCELHNVQGPVKVTGIDVRATRQAVDHTSVLTGLDELSIMGMMENLFSRKHAALIAAGLPMSDKLLLYVLAQSRQLNFKGVTFMRDSYHAQESWSTLVAAANFPALGITHPHVTNVLRKENFERMKKELVA